MKIRELWVVCLSWYVNFKIFLCDIRDFQQIFFRENGVFLAENKFCSEASGPSNERDLLKAGYLNGV